jgi:ligand-binding sensor domain-containing protein
MCKFFIFFTVLSFSTQAQHPVMRHYSTNEGLPSSECYWSLQDQKGYLWIATDAGVVKYDGYKFITYNSSKGLPDNTVFRILEDHHGRIWFATYSGKMAYYSYQADSIYTVPANEELNALTKYTVTNFCFDPFDTLYVSLFSKGYVKLYPPAYRVVEKHFLTGRFYFTRQINERLMIHGEVLTPGLLPKEKENIGKDMQKIGIKLGHNSPRQMSRIKILQKSVPCGSLSSLVRHNDTSFLFSNVLEVLQVSKNQERKVYRQDESSNYIVSTFTDHQKHVWINSITEGTKVFADLECKQLLYHFLPGLSVTSVLEDTDHGFWITTLEEGVFYIPYLSSNFINHENGMSANKVLSVVLTKKNIYCLTADYVLNEFDLLTQKKIAEERFIYMSSYLSKIDTFIVLCQFYANIFNPKTKQKIPTYEKVNNKKIPLRINKAIDYDKDHFLGFTSNGDIVQVNKLTGEGTFFLSGLPNTFSICLKHDSLWIGTKSGLYSYHNKQLHFYGKDIPLLKNRVEDMLFIGDTLFLATKGYGVLSMIHNRIIEQYTENDGLTSNITKCMTKDEAGTIWVGTNRGISRLKKSAGGQYHINSLNMSHGLVSNEINQIVINEGKLYFATNNGLGILDMKNFNMKDALIPVYIERFASNKQVYDPSLHQNFKYDQNFIAISYKGLNIRSEGDIRYKYRLEGLDTNWAYSKNTYVQFTTLPSGRYRFVVSAINHDGKLSAIPACISFTINKPFWNQAWFTILVGTVILILLYIIYKINIKAIEQKEKEKTEVNKKIAESELKALRAQMNPHFMFNAINSIQNFVLKNDSRSAQKYLTKFARLIRFVLENSKHEAVELRKEIEAIELYVELECLRMSFGFEYEISVDDSLPEAGILIPPMLIQPYVENAILHGINPLTEKKGQLFIKFFKQDSVLKCVIDDNGIGRTQAQEIKKKKELSHQSMGMEVTQDRINKFKADDQTFVTVHDKTEDGLAQGTTVEISIHISHFSHD